MSQLVENGQSHWSEEQGAVLYTPLFTGNVQKIMKIGCE